MPALSNAKHELFAQALAKGKTQDEAYRDAGYNPSRSAASRLSTNVNVVNRVAELQERSANRLMVSLESLTTELEEARLLAMKDEKGASAAVAATLGKARLHGLLIERKEVRTGALDEVQPDELDRLREELVAERARRAAGGDGQAAGGKPH